jgi:hypothetical protein
MRGLLVAGVLLLGTSAPAAGPEALQCLGRIRRDMGICMKEARERCETEFESRLAGCFGEAACPSACVGKNERCRFLPIEERVGCRLACQGDQKVALHGCRIDTAPETCRQRVRIKGAKCKQRCQRQAAPKLEACKTSFNNCLRGCAE